MESTGSPHEDRMREATLVVAQYLDLMASTARQGTARPLYGRGVAGANVIAAVESGIAGGQQTGLAHLPDLLVESGLTLPDVVGERPWHRPGLPVDAHDFPPDGSRLWEIGRPDQIRRYLTLVMDPAIDPRARHAARELVSNRHLPPEGRRVEAPDRPPRRPSGSDRQRLEELTELATGLAADSLAGHLEWASAYLTRTVEQRSVHSITHALAERLGDLYAHHRHADTWCERLLHPVDRRAVTDPYEAARRVIEQMTREASDRPAGSPGVEGRTDAATEPYRGPTHDPDGPGRRR